MKIVIDYSFFFLSFATKVGMNWLPDTSSWELEKQEQENR